jgi:hypothetical protein
MSCGRPCERRRVPRKGRSGAPHIKFDGVCSRPGSGSRHVTNWPSVGRSCWPPTSVATWSARRRGRWNARWSPLSGRACSRGGCSPRRSPRTRRCGRSRSNPTATGPESPSGSPWPSCRPAPKHRWNGTARRVGDAHRAPHGSVGSRHRDDAREPQVPGGTAVAGSVTLAKPVVVRARKSWSATGARPGPIVVTAPPRGSGRRGRSPRGRCGSTGRRRPPRRSGVRARCWARSTAGRRCPPGPSPR